MRTPFWLALLLSFSLTAVAAPLPETPESDTDVYQPTPLDQPPTQEPPPEDIEPEPVSPTLTDQERLRAAVPQFCNNQCGQQNMPWLGRILFPGLKGSVDYQKANLSEDTSYSCLCKSVQTSLNKDPIWSHNHAVNECPRRCAREIDMNTRQPGMRWTGHWWTTVWGKHSVCQCATR